MAKGTMSGIWRAAKLREKLVVIIGIIYVISPIDLIPEVILGPLGLLDDGGAILVIIAALWSAARRVRGQSLDIIEGEEVHRS